MAPPMVAMGLLQGSCPSLKPSDVSALCASSRMTPGWKVAMRLSASTLTTRFILPMFRMMAESMADAPPMTPVPPP